MQCICQWLQGLDPALQRIPCSPDYLGVIMRHLRGFAEQVAAALATGQHPDQDASRHCEQCSGGITKNERAEGVHDEAAGGKSIRDDLIACLS